MLIFVMSLFSFPLGVIAAIYLREYAKEGLLVRIVRIAVNNLGPDIQRYEHGLRQQLRHEAVLSDMGATG